MTGNPVPKPDFLWQMELGWIDLLIFKQYWDQNSINFLWLFMGMDSGHQNIPLNRRFYGPQCRYVYLFLFEFFTELSDFRQ